MGSQQKHAPRLDETRLGALPASVLRPRYDRRRVSPGVVHLGLGAFARAHVAAYTEDALNDGDREFGLIGVNLNSGEAEDALMPQDGLYSLLTRDAEGDRLQIIGALQRVVTGSRDVEAALAELTRPSTRVVSLTITEKGYCLDLARGELDPAHPRIAADLANPTAPGSAPGLIVEALRRRREAGVAPFATLSCDNLAQNGAKTRAAVVGFAALRDADLARFIERETAFPSTMVDRITPATSDEDRAAVAAALGCQDVWPVVAEPFRQWVVEDHFPSGRPRWEAGGALIVGDVAAYEVMKLRCLNGAHSTLAYLGVVAGIATISEAMEAPGFAELLRRLWRFDVLPTLRPVPGIDLADYAAALEARFRNPAIRHRTIQISADGSQKLPQRLVAPALDRLAAGAKPRVIPLAIAAWMRFLLSRDEGGASYVVADPLADRLTRLAREAGSAEAMVSALFGVREVFPAALASDAAFCRNVERQLRRLLEQGARAAVTATLAETEV